MDPGWQGISSSSAGIMILDGIKRNVDLIAFARRHGLEVTDDGKGRCPFHTPDENSSFSIFKGKDGCWRWKDFHDDAGGTIVDLLVRLENISDAEACKRLLKEYGDPRPAKKPAPPATGGPEIEREHIYRDKTGNPILKKSKFKPGGKTTWALFHKTAGGWTPGKGDGKFIPYRLNEFAGHDEVLVCEGEKDADTVNELAAGIFATSAPTGKSNWPDEITPYFSQFKKIIFLYDVGNDDDVKKHALKLHQAFSETEISIAHVPGEVREFDITDLLDLIEPEKKGAAFEDILNKREILFEGRRMPFIGSLTGFFAVELPESDPLIEGLVARQEFMFMGGVKHAHKTTAMADLGLHYASGRKSWLNFSVPKAGRFLMIQQELGEGEFRKRLLRAVEAGQFGYDNFFPYTGTGNPIRLIEDEGFNRLLDLADKFKPDIIGLDPLHTFHTSNENAYESLARIRDRINYLKTTYDCAVITSHHFSSKRPKDDPEAPTEAGGWFRGHSVLADSADVLFLLHRLPGQKDNAALRLAYEDYNLVEITLRNGKWPPKFAIEFDEETFRLRISDVWHELGAKIGYGKIREVCDAQGGEILFANLVSYFQNQLGGITPATVRNAVLKEERNGLIATKKLHGRGHPMMVESKKKP